MVAAPESKDCLDIPAVLAGKDALGSVHSCSGSLFHDTYTELGPKVAKLKVTLDNGKPDAGTAFFVEDGTHMVTSAHNVLHASELKIDYQGKQYQAVLEKLDDANELAEIKIKGLDADPSRAVKIGPVPLTTNERVVGVGIPGLDAETTYINPGVLLGSNRLMTILTDPSLKDPEVAKIQAGLNSTDPVVQQTADNFANSPRLVMNQGARPGESGGPIVDSNFNLVAVTTQINGNNGTVNVPYTKVQELLAKPEQKFDLNYAVSNDFSWTAVGTNSKLLSGELSAGLTVARVTKNPRFAPVAFAAMRAYSFGTEINDLFKTTDANEKTRLEFQIGEDAGMIAGGGVASAMWNNPVGKYVGLGLLGVSLAARLYTDAQEPHYRLNNITRKDGTPSKPWNY